MSRLIVDDIETDPRFAKLNDPVADLPKIKAAGVTALCLGDKDIFASAQLLESVLISKLGPDGWRGLFTAKTSFDSPEVRSAVQTYGTLLGAANTDHTALTWDQAVVIDRNAMHQLGNLARTGQAI